MPAASANRAWDLESFLDSLIVELDKARDTLAVKAVNQDRKADVFQLLQSARGGEFLLPGAVSRIIFRRVRLSRVQKKECDLFAVELLLQTIERPDLERAHGTGDRAGHEDDVALAAKIAQANQRAI